MILMVYQNVVKGLENLHIFLEWYKDKKLGIVFVGEAWIEKNGRGAQSHPSFAHISVVKKRRRVMVYTRKGLESKINIVNEEDNYVTIQEKNKGKCIEVYMNRKIQVERWKSWLGRLEEEMGRDSSILVDWNAYSYSWYKAKEQDGRGKMMVECMTGTGWMVMEGDSGPM